MVFNSSLNNYFPLTVRLILVKALLFFIIYKFIFSLELKFLHAPLTSHVGEYTLKLLNTFTESSHFHIKREYINGLKTLSSQIYFKDTKVVFIAESCNGFIAFMRYLGLIFCFPSRLWRKLLYIILGLIIIHILNIFRCAALAYINLYHQSYFDISHDYILKLVIYGTIFLLWISFLKKISFRKKKIQKNQLQRSWFFHNINM